MDYINIALAKGRLADHTFQLFEQMGLVFLDYHKKSRKLIFENPDEKIRLVFVKANDVPVYVERGAADIGIVGKDTLLESGANVYEVLDLGFGKCKFAVAALGEYPIPSDRKIRVATKYPEVAKKYFASRGRSIDIIKLNGSVELAPLVGLADVIVDIVETGKTLKENGLVVLENICEVSARVIANRVSFKTKSNRISKLLRGFEAILDEMGETENEDHICKGL
ncbi:MAG: ATP phosphoribosyltransferase [Bacillota bacterium]